MPILKFPSRKDDPAFLRDIEEDGLSYLQSQ
jgi:hypothetical protein